jgi:hypothetical protein
MDVLPAQDTASITLLPRPYSDVVDVEKYHPNMLYVAKDVRGITPYALTFKDVGSSILNEGGLVLVLMLLFGGVLFLPMTFKLFISLVYVDMLLAFIFNLMAFGIPFIMLRKVSKLIDSDVPIDAFDKVGQRILQYDVTREDGKIKVDYHGINELPYQDIHASVKSVNIVSAGGMSKTYFLQLNWLDNKRNIVNQLVSSFPATSDAYARAQWQFIRSYMEKDADSLPPITPFDLPKTTKEHKIYLYTDSILPSYGVTQNFKVWPWYIPLLVLQAYVKLGGGWIQSKGRNIINEPQYQHLQYPSDQPNPYLDPNIDPYRLKVINNQSKRFLWRWRIIWILHTLIIILFFVFMFSL